MFGRVRGCVSIGCLVVGAVATGGVFSGVAEAQDWEELQFSQPRETAARAVSDGRRWAGYELVDGSARLIDTASGRVLTVHPPKTCERRYSYGGLVAIGGGRAMWHCTQRQMIIRLYDLKRNRWETPAAGRNIDCFGGAPFAIGRHWIVQSCYGHHTRSFIYTNWRTGTVHQDDYGSPFPHSAAAVADLDARTGRRPLCEPLRRSRDPDAGESPYDVRPEYFGYLFDGRYGIDRIDFGGEGENLRVQRCGGDFVLDRPARVESVQLGGGLVSWLEADGYVRAFRFSDQRGFEANRTAALVHTRHAVYASETKQIDGQWRTFTSVAGIPPALP